MPRKLILVHTMKVLQNKNECLNFLVVGRSRFTSCSNEVIKSRHVSWETGNQTKIVYCVFNSENCFVDISFVFMNIYANI